MADKKPAKRKAGRPKMNLKSRHYKLSDETQSQIEFIMKRWALDNDTAAVRYALNRVATEDGWKGEEK